MKIALVLCPYFTNGDWPPLGLACVNGALLAAGHETRSYDFSFQAVQEEPVALSLYRSLVNLGRVGDEVVFVLQPELLLYCLFKREYPDFPWEVPGTAEEKKAAAMLLLGLSAAVQREAEQVLADAPDAVFFSTYVSNLLWSLCLAREIRFRRPETPVVFGGPGVGLPEVRRLVFSLDAVSALVVGEGERSAVALANDPEEAFSGSVPGVAVRREGKIVLIPRRPEPLEDLPEISFQGFPRPGETMAAYARNRPSPLETPFYRGVPVYSSRGCVNRCAYCSETAYWRGYRLRPAEKVSAEIFRRAGESGERWFHFGDSSVNGNRRWLWEFCGRMEELKPGVGLCGYMIAGPELEEELAGKAFAAGFRYVSLGIETFSAGIRERMNKRHAGDELFHSLLALTRAGVHVKANLLVGFPGESEEEFEASLEYIRRARRLSETERGPGVLIWDAGHPLRLEAYSDMYNHPAAFGITILDRPVPPLPPTLSPLQEVIAPLFKSWTAPGREELSRRVRKMKEEAAGGKDEK